MKPTLSRFLVLILFITFLTITSASPTGAQPPEPPEIMENGEFPSNADSLQQSISNLRETTVNVVKNSVNAATSYWSISGATFVPSTNTITYNYSGYGCVNTGSNSDIWRGIVNLPHGSTIVGMWFNYANVVEDPADSQISLTRYSYDGFLSNLIIVSGTDTGLGFHAQVSTTVTYPLVDNFNHTYALVWSGKTSQNLCGVNLAYTPPPFFFNALPMINR